MSVRFFIWHDPGNCLLQIIDMGFHEKSASVLGAALHWQDGQDKLLILVPTQLLVYTIAVS